MAGKVKNIGGGDSSVLVEARLLDSNNDELKTKTDVAGEINAGEAKASRCIPMGSMAR